ncbi:MAG: WecB/TagA/CpsF family glycosyltransferase [Candidatus Amulumruptor caecigallinarius]|nr:WecB/TagA/CpsF family glycosyltransferase [Candidatus Amulumruptor caecigallinarius]
MVKSYFNINYEFDKDEVFKHINYRLSLPGSDYISVADGVILSTANSNSEYLDVINNGMFAICDSGYVPVYIRLIHGIKYKQYSGSQIFMDIVKMCKYRMAFLGAQQNVLDGLKESLVKHNPYVKNMLFYELPFLPVEEFDYPAIAEMVDNDGAEIIWVALGAPKQEYFMSHLKPYLHHGIMIAVGAAFKFHSNTDVRRAPEWMIRNHMEFIHRIIVEPKKQIRRCRHIIGTLPMILWNEWQRKNSK